MQSTEIARISEICNTPSDRIIIYRLVLIKHTNIWQLLSISSQQCGRNRTF